jgi:hypothetical protein
MRTHPQDMEPISGALSRDKAVRVAFFYKNKKQGFMVFPRVMKYASVRFLNLCTGWGRVVSFKLRPLFLLCVPDPDMPGRER